MNDQNRMRELIAEECSQLAALLLRKNKSYGNSVGNPANIFAKVGPMEQINVRIDDKLNRIAKGSEFENEDTEQDLIGYLILKRCVRRLLNEKEPETWDDNDCDELSDDDLDRAADLFLARTGRRVNGTQQGPRISTDGETEEVPVGEDYCRCQPAKKG